MTFLVFVEFLAASVWIGGFAVIGVVARIARAQLNPAQRVLFFRSLGRAYLRVGGVALVVALGCGGALLAQGSWTATKTAALIAGAALALATVAGVVQARALTRLRQQQLQGSDSALDGRIERRQSRAMALRVAIGLLTILELAIGTGLAV